MALVFFQASKSCVLIGSAQSRNRYPDSQTNSNSGILRQIEKWERTDFKASSPEVLASKGLSTWLSRGANPGLKRTCNAFGAWKLSSKKYWGRIICSKIWIWDFQAGVNFSSFPTLQRILAISEDFVGCHSREFGRGGLLGVKARDVAKHLQHMGQTPTCLIHNANSARFEKTWFR